MAKWQAKQRVGTITVSASGGTATCYPVKDNVPIEDPNLLIIPESAGRYKISVYFAEELAYEETFSYATDKPVLNHIFEGLFPANIGNETIPRYFDPDRNPNYIGESIKVILTNNETTRAVFYVYATWKSHEGAAFDKYSQES